MDSEIEKCNRCGNDIEKGALCPVCWRSANVGPVPPDPLQLMDQAIMQITNTRTDAEFRMLFEVSHREYQNALSRYLDRAAGFNIPDFDRIFADNCCRMLAASDIFDRVVLTEDEDEVPSLKSPPEEPIQ